MPSRSAIGVCLAFLSVLACLAALMPAAHAQDRSHDPSWGPVAGGLRMSIARTPSSGATTAQFRVAIENSGERDADRQPPFGRWARLTALRVLKSTR